MTASFDRKSKPLIAMTMQRIFDSLQTHIDWNQIESDEKFRKSLEKAISDFNQCNIDAKHNFAVEWSFEKGKHHQLLVVTKSLTKSLRPVTWKNALAILQLFKDVAAVNHLRYQWTRKDLPCFYVFAKAKE